MPNATSFTIKDGAAVDTVFSNVQPAGGTLPALYFARAKGSFPVQQPSIGLSSAGKQGGVRVVKQTVKTPILQTDASSGISKVIDYMFTEVNTTMPGTATVADRANHRAYVANSLDVPQVAESHQDGYAPN